MIRPDQHGRLTRREFIRTSAVAAGALLLGPTGCAAGDNQAKSPNLLFVFPDQMRAASLGCMGNPDMHTPNLDSLARQGTLFTNAISNYPLCTPFRAMLMTGRYPTTTGVVTNGVELRDDEVTIAEVLKARGYKTGYIGKWHLEKNPDPFVPKSRRQGFDYWAVRNTGGPHYDSFYCGNTEEHVPILGYVPETQTRLAIEFMEKNSEGPFCLFVSYSPPHPPYDPPERFRTLYDPKKLHQRPNVPNDSYRNTLANYCGAISAIDDNVGKLMSALDKLKIADNTIVCFSSDHGDMMGSHDRIGKNVPWEESINIPLILRYPGRVRQGAKSDILIGAVDLMPTLLGLCGVQPPKGVQGLDLSKQVRGNGGPEPESVLIERVIGGKEPRIPVVGWRGVRTARHTYVRGKDQAWLLYDNAKDPYQMNNLVDKPEAKAVREKLQADLLRWLKKVGDDFASSDEWRRRVRGHAVRRVTREDEG